MSEQTLMSLAILTVNWNRGQDAIDSFVPLIAECVRKRGEEPVSLVDLQDAVFAEVGIKIPGGALQTILARCARRGLVRREHGVYVPVQAKLAELDFGPVQAEALRQHRCLLDKLQAFAAEKYRLEWSNEETQEALLGYLQQGSLPVLVAAVEGDPVPVTKPQSRKARHVVSSFAGHLAEADPEGFACLETVVKGHILSGVLFYPDIGAVQTRFDELDVYCDTPFLLRALGYSEHGLHLQCVDLVELLRDAGANLKCFHHTREEVVGVLEFHAGRLRSASANQDAVDYTTSRPFRLNELEEMILKIDATFEALGIAVVDTPPWSEQPDEVALEEEIKAVIEYARDRAREKDVKSLAAVARARTLKRMDRFESAKAIFVTTNMSLARASSYFFRDIEGKGSIPICMPVELMTRLAWVKRPFAAPDLPRHAVMASSFAALNPSTALWREYMDEVAVRREKGELSDADYVFLRTSLEARRALMDETFGDEQAFSAGTLDEVLAHAKATIQAEAKAETEAERRAREAAEVAAAAALERADRIDRAHRARVGQKGRRRGAIVGWGIAGLIGAVCLVGVIASVPGVLDIDTEWRYVLWIALASFLAFNVLMAFRGTTILSIRQRISADVEHWVARRGHRDLDRLHGTESEPDS